MDITGEEVVEILRGFDTSEHVWYRLYHRHNRALLSYIDSLTNENEKLRENMAIAVEALEEAIGEIKTDQDSCYAIIQTVYYPLKKTLAKLRSEDGENDE